jgi:mycothiol synthase
MIRSLDELPPVVVPAGYCLRPYEVGDEEAWARLLNAAFATEDREPVSMEPASFEKEYPLTSGCDRSWIFFAEQLEDGALVGTTAAWEAELEGKRMGLIHWVAVAPDHRGRGLGEALMAAALHAMRDRGHTQAFLNTDVVLRSAVRLYERVGFKRLP